MRTRYHCANKVNIHAQLIRTRSIYLHAVNVYAHLILTHSSCTRSLYAHAADTHTILMRTQPSSQAKWTIKTELAPCTLKSFQINTKELLQRVVGPQKQILEQKQT